MDAAEARGKLDLPAIVAAALDLLDEIGLDALSTRKLAARLGVKGPSLYWHVKNMGELHALMAEALLEASLPPSTAPITAGAWRPWLAAGARGIRQAALSRRDGARLLATAKPTEGRRARYPTNTARLEAEGFEPEAARAAFVSLSRYALGAALGEQTGQMPAGAAADSFFEFGLQAMLDGLEVRRRA